MSYHRIGIEEGLVDEPDALQVARDRLRQEAARRAGSTIGQRRPEPPPTTGSGSGFSLASVPTWAWIVGGIVAWKVVKR